MTCVDAAETTRSETVAVDFLCPNSCAARSGFCSAQARKNPSETTAFFFACVPVRAVSYTGAPARVHHGGRAD